MKFIALCVTLLILVHSETIVEEFENQLISHIFPVNDEDEAHNRYMQMMHTLMNFSKYFNLLIFDQEDINTQLLECKKGDKGDFFKFPAVNSGRLGTKDDQSTITLTHRDDDCFDSMQASYEKDELKKEITITFTPGHQNSNNCREAYILGSTASYNILTVKSTKQHVVKFRHLTQKEIDVFDSYGVHIFRTCDSISNLLADLLMTVELFFGGFSTKPWLGPVFGSHPAPWMEKSNVEFIEKATGFKWKTRQNVFVDLDDLEVHSGDFLAITRFDGVDQIIQWGAGSHSGHSCVLLEVDGEMQVVESQDGWYWPKHGIQRNTWTQWKKWARNAGFNVAVLPLSPESRAKFDVKKAADWFKTMEGFPYGYHNFLFGWIDTEKDNYPPLLDMDFVAMVFSILEKIDKPLVVKFLNEALNKRLGTEGLTLAEITIEASKRGISFAQLFAQVEQDSWVYSDGPSMVCSSFVIGVYKAGGLFDDLEINATEFTPKDVYTLNFFDSNYIKPKKCQGVDDSLPYCQIMGKYLMELPGYNTQGIYAHMNEHCPSMPPEYKRTDGC